MARKPTPKRERISFVTGEFTQTLTGKWEIYNRSITHREITFSRNNKKARSAAILRAAHEVLNTATPLTLDKDCQYIFREETSAHLKKSLVPVAFFAVNALNDKAPEQGQDEQLFEVAA